MDKVLARLHRLLKHTTKKFQGSMLYPHINTCSIYVIYVSNYNF